MLGASIVLATLVWGWTLDPVQAGDPPVPPEPPGQFRAIIVLKEQADPKQAVAHLLGQGRQKAARAAAVSQALKAVADRTQGPIRGLLVAAERRGDAGKVRPFWIFNGIAVTATPQVLWQISEQPEIKAVVPDRAHGIGQDRAQETTLSPQGDPHETV
jgi:bacillopeptidase F